MNDSTPATYSHVFAWREALRDTRDPKLNSSAKLVGMMLSMYLNRRCRAWPGVENLAQDCSLAPSTIKRGLRTLEQRGWIIREGGGKGQRATEYAAHIPPDHSSRRSTSTESGISGFTMSREEKGMGSYTTPMGSPRDHNGSQTYPQLEDMKKKESADQTLERSGSAQDEEARALGLPPGWNTDNLAQYIVDTYGPSSLTPRIYHRELQANP